MPRGEDFLRDLLGGDSYDADEANVVGGSAPPAPASGSRPQGSPNAPRHEPTAQERREQAEAEIAEEGSQPIPDKPNFFERLIDPTIGGEGGGVPGGGGYALSPDELAVKIRKWEDIAERIARLERRFRNALEHANPPSDDPPARAHAEALRASIKAAWDHNMANARYARGLVDAMKRAHGGYEIEEEEASGVFTKADTGGGASSSGGTGSLYEKRGGSGSTGTGSLFEKKGS